MAMRNPYQTYKQNSVETASPGELTLMLFNGCLKFIKQAKQDIDNQNIEGKHTNIIKAENIIHELMVTLNMDIPVAKDMLKMYDYMNRRLVEANITNDISILDEVEVYATEFRDTWKEVIQQVRQQKYQGGNV
ncbi:flagellar export chaperone FliS [Calidifontibacillus oryziterrae]|uniref:flagellar export chaperone FliS n=1 Tax=Calidifontibacillus oryziterrae TaxID=1191699 RepID=UPI000366C50E|nr:flagellar export chaperone FliS [Calidifontibacillus oryziterrae]